MTDALLLDVLHTLRERGALGENSLDGAVAHAASFAAALASDVRSVLDLGSGGGLPGLVIARQRPDLRMVLVDRRERRMDLLRRACARLELSDRVEVLTADVRWLALRFDMVGAFDAVTARAFGEPAFTLRCARPFLRPGGMLIVSDPPPQVGVDPRDRWPSATMTDLGFTFVDPPFAHVQRLVCEAGGEPSSFT